MAGSDRATAAIRDDRYGGVPDSLESLTVIPAQESSIPPARIGKALAVGTPGTSVVTRIGKMIRPASMMPIILNDRWRMVDDPLQWILQRRSRRENSVGNRGKVPAAVWIGSAFCRTPYALLRTIRERCGPVAPEALAAIEGWLERHEDVREPKSRLPRVACREPAEGGLDR